jgi:hypothetical protein
MGESIRQPENNWNAVRGIRLLKKSCFCCVKPIKALLLYLTKLFLDWNSVGFFLNPKQYRKCPIKWLQNTLVCGTLFSAALIISP